MIGVEEHLETTLAGVRALAPLELALLEAQGCVLAEDVVSTLDVPGFDNSAMDGYAVRAGDVVTASAEHPVRLPVSADLPAGITTPTRVAAGYCARIMTGAPMPEGADAIVKVEDTDGGTSEVRIHAPAPVGRHVRPTGDDVRRGDVVLSAGTLLGPAHLAVAASVGRSQLRAYPRPRVVIMSSGDELVQPGQAPAFGQVVDSNGVMLAAAVRDAGGAAYRVSNVGDDPDAFLAALGDQLPRADLVITTGGVSMGAYDVVKEALGRLGGVRFEAVAMQPGKPQGFGSVGPDAPIPIFTLPGNPVSSFVSFEVFVRPAIRKMSGRRTLFRRTERATMLAGWTSPAHRRQYARGVIGSDERGRRVVRPADAQGSHLLGGLAHANVLAIVPEDVTRVEAGDELECLVLEKGQG